MKAKQLLGLCMLTLGLGVGSAQSAQAEIGQPAPEFTLTDIDGRTHSLSDYQGKTVILEWVNPLCPFVVKNYEKSRNIPKLQASAIADGAVWLVINSANHGGQGDYAPDAVKTWQSKNGSAPTAYFRDQDGTVGRLYAAKTTPQMYIINAEGTLIYNGAIDSIRSADPADIGKAENYVTSALTSLANGEAVKTPVTRPYGCSVKY